MKSKPRVKDTTFEDKHHISEQADGTTEQTLGGLGRVEETLETKVSEVDGVLEDHITYKQCVTSRYFFGNSGNKRFQENYDAIDFTK